MSQQDRVQLFDDWAEEYDETARANDGFPFDGYESVLREIVRAAAPSAGMKVLDLGTGTGNLAAQFVEPGCTIWAMDFSAKMLEKARERLPGAVIVQSGLLEVWPAELNRRFDRIVAAYVLHELDLSAKVELLGRLADRYLAAGGRIVVGDVAYPTVESRELARLRWADRWDEDEFYWAADEAVAACARAGLRAAYAQVSSCGGVFVVESV